MKDMLGTEIVVGDRVAFVEKGYMQIQTVTGFKTQVGGDTVHYVTLSDENCITEHCNWKSKPKKMKVAVACLVLNRVKI